MTFFPLPLLVLALSSLLVASPSFATPSSEQQQIDLEKQREHGVQHPSALQELSRYVDAVFHRIRDRLDGRLQKSDRSAKELKDQLSKLQADVEAEVDRQHKRAETTETIAERKRVLAKLRDHLKRLGDEVFDEVQKTAERLKQLSEEEDVGAGTKKKR